MSKRQEVVIAGFTTPKRTRPFFGALAPTVREKAEEFLKERSLTSYYDDVALKGLQLAQLDLDRDALDLVRLTRIRDTVSELVDDLSDQPDR